MDQTENLPAVIDNPRVALGTLEASSAAELVSGATVLADSLRDVIRRQQLTVQIAGKEYVKCEGWLTLGTMLGVLPQEVRNEKQEDGGYIATVELVSMQTGKVIARATGEVGMDEPTWAHRPAFARRSMAATRATSKAARLAFSWVMALAGYETTPAEEMDGVEPIAASKPLSPTAARPPTPKPVPATKPKADAPTPDDYVVGLIEKVTAKPGTSSKTGEPFIRTSALIDGTWYSTFDTSLGDMLQTCQGENVRLGYRVRGQYRDALTVELPEVGNEAVPF